MSFIKDDFMLKNETAKKLYDFVKDLPIIDYHCHISPKMIAEDYKFNKQIRFKTKVCIKDIIYYYNNGRKGSLLNG